MRATLLIIIKLKMPEKVKDLILNSIINSKFIHGSNTDSVAAFIILELLCEACLITYKIKRLEIFIYL